MFEKDEQGNRKDNAGIGHRNIEAKCDLAHRRSTHRSCADSEPDKLKTGETRHVKAKMFGETLCKVPKFRHW